MQPILTKPSTSSWSGARGPVVMAGFCLLLAAILSPLGSSGFGQEGLAGWGANPWQPGKSKAWNSDNMTPGQRQRMMRHWAFMNREVPESYLATSNDVGYTTKAIADGGPLYLAHCTRCHGETGLGNGALAQDLTPSPALLAYLVQQPIAVDHYLLWTISEGGRKFDTAMPAFKDALTQDQIWQIIAYLRAGLPLVEDETGPSQTVGEPPVKSDMPAPATKPGG